jgi:hypothetical protein
MKNKEVKKGDMIYYKGISGGAYIIVCDRSKKSFFAPNKKGINVKGEKFPLLKYEKFSIVSFDIVGKETKDYNVNISLTRLIAGGQTFIISQDSLYNYFAVEESRFH